MNMHWSKAPIVAAMIALMAAPVMAQNLLLNPSFETGAGSPDDWTLAGNAQWPTSATPDGWFAVGPSDGTKFIGVVTNGVNDVSGTATQSVTLPGGVPGDYAVKLSYTARIHDAGSLLNNDVILGQVIVDGTPVAAASVGFSNRNGEDVHIRVRGVPWVGTINSTLEVRLTLTANVGSSSGWGVLAVDEVELELDPVRSISPTHIVDNSGDTFATIKSTNLSGTPTVKLVHSVTATELTGAGVNVVDSETVTATFPTDGEAFGLYDVVIDTGSEEHILPKGFAIRDPAGNLIFNGDFDGDTPGTVPVGWSVWRADWSGITDISAYNTVSIFNPTPLTYNNSPRSMRQQEGGSGDGGLVQSIDVVPGETLDLTWVWAGGDNASSASAVSHETSIFTGSLVNVHNLFPDLEIESKDGSVDFNWEAGAITFQVPSNVYSITVNARTWHFPDSLVATYWDEFVLVPGGCANQHTVDPAGAAQIEGVNDQIVVNVTGANLDLVDGVTLYHAGTFFGAASFSSSGGGTALQATFNPPAYNPGTGSPRGWPLGTYDLKTSQTGCTTATTTSVVEVQCLDASSLSGLSDSSLAKPQGTVQMVVSGANLDLIDEIALVQPLDYSGFPQPDMPESSRTAQGTIIDDSNPSAIVVEFDLWNKAVGPYDIVAYRYDRCHYDGFYDVDGDFINDHVYFPIELASQFTLDLPDPSFLQAIPNGDFEDGGPAGPAVLAPWTGSSIVRGPHDCGADPDNNYFGFCPELPYYFAAQAANGSTSTPAIEQSLGLPPGGMGDYELVLAFDTLMFDHSFRPASTVTASIVVDEGLPTESVSSVVVSEDSWVWPMEWLTVTVDWSGNVTTDIKVRIEFFVENNDGLTPFANVAVDNFELYVISPCNSPFADADGDRDIDQDDFAVLQECFTGNVASNLSDACACFDRDGDTDVDQADVDKFEDCATGPGVQIDPNDPGTWPVGCGL